eukprot:CAMPEP_0169176844 /NCGR_PEP_ID=MMETSP1015-20121227/66132_1 /TAXON_ID=342587 /ORGANISM="Karlodinium micrum, Strain CCMP2283" /LENGTH=59 /DNA_ID=CAMNT_0009251469 /DNA_START=47 /DNA_END=223 /DNA_ORIENTATION=+
MGLLSRTLCTLVNLFRGTPKAEKVVKERTKCHANGRNGKGSPEPAKGNDANGDADTSAV